MPFFVGVVTQVIFYGDFSVYNFLKLAKSADTITLSTEWFFAPPDTLSLHQ